MAATPNLRVQLGDWGYLIVLEQVAEAPVADGTKNARGAVNALHVVLTADHAGLPAGNRDPGRPRRGGRLDPGRATGRDDADDDDAGEARPPRRRAARRREAAAEAARAGRAPEPPGLGLPAAADGRLGAALAGGYVFPVYGPSSFIDTFGAARAGVGWHHGEDIFAPLGAPLLAVADGTVFSVGWNDLGGYRLWLRDRQGNQFYYAHLSAFSPLAVDGNEVKAGDVVGFVGNTGDAQTTPYHLHFEIHPVGLLPLGYDGVVNAFPYLSAWRRLEDVTFAAGRGWAPPVPSNATAPRPAAILLGSTDISSASGLEPGSLDRALAAPVSQGDSAVLGAG